MVLAPKSLQKILSHQITIQSSYDENILKFFCSYSDPILIHQHFIKYQPKCQTKYRKAVLQPGPSRTTSSLNSVSFTHKSPRNWASRLLSKKPSSKNSKKSKKTPSSDCKYLPAVYFMRNSEGCEGFTYKFKFDNLLKETDFVYKLKFDPNKDTRIVFVANGEEMKLLKGATIDYAQQMMREIFYVKENPNAEISCSCKSSFSPKDYVL